MDDETERLADINIDLDLDDGASCPRCWRALLYFTSASHIVLLFLALFFSVSTGFVIPIMSIYMGKIFDYFSDFGAGQLGGKELVERVYSNSLVLCGLGGASGVLNGAFYGSWLIFGELQAKAAREQVFDGMLAKDLSWYDRRDSGVEALVSRIERLAHAGYSPAPPDFRQPRQRPAISQFTTAGFHHTVHCYCIGCSHSLLLLCMEPDAGVPCGCAFLGRRTGPDLSEHTACCGSARPLPHQCDETSRKCYIRYRDCQVSQ